MVEAKEGKIDIAFFKNIILKQEKIKYRNVDCQESKYKIEYIDGWITDFFGYYKDKKDNLKRLYEKINRNIINKLPSQILNIPFKVKNIQTNQEKEMKFEAGIFGCTLNEKKEISLGIGWLVSPSYLPKKGKDDLEFYNLKDEYLGYDEESDESNNSKEEERQ